jgi:hypothetical protein
MQLVLFGMQAGHLVHAWQPCTGSSVPVMSPSNTPGSHEPPDPSPLRSKWENDGKTLRENNHKRKNMSSHGQANSDFARNDEPADLCRGCGARQGDCDSRSPHVPHSEGY